VQILLIVLGLAVVAGAAVFGASTLGRMKDADQDLQPVQLPDDRWTTGADVDRTRFAVAWRGYRMGQVDDVLDRISRDLVQCLDYIEQLTEVITAAGKVAPPRPQPIVSQTHIEQAEGEDNTDASNSAGRQPAASTDADESSL